MPPHDVVLVLTTVPDDDQADTLARVLVEERLAACVSLQAPMRSTYQWKGRVESSLERQVVIKTVRALLPALAARLGALHPYDLPEFLVLDVEGGEAYLRWIRDAVQSA
jgi:periplasmic divalent cation tolerance protein